MNLSMYSALCLSIYLSMYLSPSITELLQGFCSYDYGGCQVPKSVGPISQCESEGWSCCRTRKSLEAVRDNAFSGKVLASNRLNKAPPTWEGTGFTPSGDSNVDLIQKHLQIHPEYCLSRQLGIP